MASTPPTVRPFSQAEGPFNAVEEHGALLRVPDRVLGGGVVLFAWSFSPMVFLSHSLTYEGEPRTLCHRPAPVLAVVVVAIFVVAKAPDGCKPKAMGIHANDTKGRAGGMART